MSSNLFPTIINLFVWWRLYTIFLLYFMHCGILLAALLIQAIPRLPALDKLADDPLKPGRGARP
jgi:hypothetical protein